MTLGENRVLEIVEKDFQKKIKLTSIIRLLESFDVNRVLARGFSITNDQEGKIIKSFDSLKQGQTINTTLFRGKISSQIKNIYE